jgi:hypothetical protein
MILNGSAQLLLNLKKNNKQSLKIVDTSIVVPVRGMA